MTRLFKNKKVLIMGLGLHGGGAGDAKFFAKQGAEVLVTDLKTGQQLDDSLKKLAGLKIKYSLGGHKEADFLWPDLIIKNPDVPGSSPYLEIARKNNVAIETGLTIFFKTSKAFIIGITGTKGKSTTASLIYHFLKSLPAGRQENKKRVFLAGNIGISPLELLGKVKKGDKVVLELSSFGLEDLEQSPDIAVITNIMEDHLNRYGSMAEYIDAKKIIFKHQNKNNFLVLNKEDPASAGFAKEALPKVYFFSAKEKPSWLDLHNFNLFGKHNLSNLMAAIKVAELLKVPAKNIEKSLKTFKGVPGRQEFIREVGGVKYFNDTTATMPEAVITAVEAFSERFPNSKMTFICGGQNKGLNYSKLSKTIKERVDNLVMLPGSAYDKITEGLTGYKNIYNVASMDEAVKKAASIAEKGSVIVLSPGAASFNLFKNEFDRGDQFVKIVKNLKQNL